MFDSIRASMLLGKGHKYLQNGRYQDALEKARKARSLKLNEQFELLCNMIEGKAWFHLGDHESALPALQKAQEILGAKLQREKNSKPLQNIMDDITQHIEKIQSAG